MSFVCGLESESQSEKWISGWPVLDPKMMDFTKLPTSENLEIKSIYDLYKKTIITHLFRDEMEKNFVCLATVTFQKEVALKREYKSNRACLCLLCLTFTQNLLFRVIMVHQVKTEERCKTNS